MSDPRARPKEKKRDSSRWLLLAGLLGAALGILFHRSFQAGEILFANDGSLGVIKATENRLPGTFTGAWQCLNWIGGASVSAAPNLSNLLSTLFPPEIFQKLYAPFSLFFVGFSAWLFFRQLRFNPMVCVLVGLAAGLNTHFFSTACWGLGGWNLAIGMIFLALAALTTKAIPQTWAKIVLAGLAVGMNLMEGLDCGAILSVYVGLFIIFQAGTEESPIGEKIWKSIWSSLAVVIVAAIFAAQIIFGLINTQIKDIAGTGQDTETKEQHWDFCTQWSLPKMETLRVIIPGLYGYRLKAYITDTNQASAYWGRIGEDPKISELESADPQVRAKAATDLRMSPQDLKILQNGDEATRNKIVEAYKTGMQRRNNSSGEYAGLLISLLAIFALTNAGRSGQSPYSRSERKAVWFWGAIALGSVLAAWGRHGFIYRLLYQLPYFSTIRNPIKFLHPFHIAWLILSAYGLEAMTRRYLSVPRTRTKGFVDHLKMWWSKVVGFEKRWTIASALAIVAAISTLAILGANQNNLAAHLQTLGFTPDLAPGMARFCLGEMIWFVVILILSTGALIGILSGAWSGPRAKWAWIFLGAILLLDLGHSDRPWISYFNYKEKYVMNPVVQFLKQDPHEHRVATRLSPIGPYTISGDNDFRSLCHFWLQNDFPYNDVQTIEIAQMPRMPVMERTFFNYFTPKNDSEWWLSARLWKLTNTRFILCAANVVPLLNQRAAPNANSFGIKARLNDGLKSTAARFEDWGDLTVDLDPNGPFALVEFTNALPRAKLFANWQTPNDDKATLETLASKTFDPAQQVLIAKETPVSTPATGNVDPGTVTITDYQPKYVKLQASVKTAAVMLLNDRTDPNWKVSVDGTPASLLRCNYLMRGVFLPPGEHQVEFRFQPPLLTLYVSMAAWAGGILLAGYLIFAGAKKPKN